MEERRSVGRREEIGGRRSDERIGGKERQGEWWVLEERRSLGHRV